MSEKNIAKAAGAVSIGSLIIQIGGVAGQFVYAIWLTPADFGLWATASAAMSLLGSLLNAGEANAYLAGTPIGISGPFKRSQRFNYILGTIGILVALAFVSLEDFRVAALVGVLACGLPLQGRATMLVGVFIKVRSQKRLITFQAFGTAFRLMVGILVASIWNSPLALALAYVSYSFMVVLLGQLWLRRSANHLVGAESTPAGGWSLRADRAVHQFSQTMPSQIDYLTIATFASAQVLGLYFFAYQATSAISGMLSAPLSKATMSELGRIDRASRIPLVSRLLVPIVALVGLGAAVVSLLIWPLSDVLGERWKEVLAPLVILLSSLPSRFVIPITEALNMVNAKWRRSIVINSVDATGVCVAALVALLVLGGDVVTLATCITFWKIIFGSLRAIFVLRGRRVFTALIVVVPNIIFASLFVFSIYYTGYFTGLAFIFVFLITACQLIVFAISIKRSQRAIKETS